MRGGIKRRRSRRRCGKRRSYRLTSTLYSLFLGTGEEGGEAEGEKRGKIRSFRRLLRAPLLAGLVVVSGSGMCKAGIAGFTRFARCVPFCSWQAQMLCIVASMNQKDVFALIVDSGSGLYKAGIADILHLAMCLFRGWQAHDARHRGRREPDGHFRGLRRSFVVAQRFFPMV